VSAPAGFGKTALISDWARQAGRRMAWVSLDERDNDPSRFWSDVVAALQTLEPGIGESARSLVQSPQPLPAQAFLTALINEVTAEASGALEP